MDALPALCALKECTKPLLKTLWVFFFFVKFSEIQIQIKKLEWVEDPWLFWPINLCLTSLLSSLTLTYVFPQILAIIVISLRETLMLQTLCETGKELLTTVKVTAAKWKVRTISFGLWQKGTHFAFFLIVNGVLVGNRIFVLNTLQEEHFFLTGHCE